MSCDRPRVSCDLHLQMVEPMERMKKRRLRISRHQREEEMLNPLKVGVTAGNLPSQTLCPQGRGRNQDFLKLRGASLVWRLSCVELIIAHLRGVGGRGQSHFQGGELLPLPPPLTKTSSLLPSPSPSFSPSPPKQMFLV